MTAPNPPIEPPPERDSRQRLTVLFTDLSDSTQLSQAMEAEDYAEMLDELRRVFREEVAAHHGAVNQYQGDGLQAVFGYPQTRETDGLHAAETAVAVHRRVRGLRQRYAALGAPELSVHTGIHGGLALARLGDGVGGRLELYGTVPGLAKHLSDVAERDDILVSEETLGPDHFLFDSDARRLVQLKGKDSPVVIRRLLSRTALRTRFEAHVRRGLVPFVGRAPEMARLESALRELAQRRSATIAIRAEPGTGKTRLIEEFLARMTPGLCTVLRGFCEAELSTEPLQPIVQMLRRHLELLPGMDAQAATQLIRQRLGAGDKLLAEQTADLLRLLGVSAAPDASDGASAAQAASPSVPLSLGRSAALLIRLIEALIQGKPLLVFIDDWQWADDATRQFALALRDRQDLPMLAVLAMRPSQDDMAAVRDVELIDLKPLSSEETESAISQLLPSADPFLVQTILGQAGGNPLFVEELCHSLANAATGPGPAIAAGGSAWLESLISSRAARLSHEQERVLAAAAVIGNRVPEAWLQALCGCDTQHPLVLSLAQADLLFPEATGTDLRFKHGITREVVYASIGLQRRRSLHRQMAAVLALDPQASPAALAYHHAGAGQHSEAADCAQKAGDRAMAIGALDRSRAFYRLALEMLERQPASPAFYPSWRSVLRRLGMTCVFDPARADVAHFRQGVQRALENNDKPGLAYANYWLAYILYSLGDSREAVRLCQQAAESAQEIGDSWLIAQASATLGQALAATSDYVKALDMLTPRVPAVLTYQGRQQRSPGLAYSLTCKASTLGDMGRFDEAMACFDDALAAVPSRGHPVEGSVLCWRSAVHLWQAQWELALQDALAAEHVARRVRSLYHFGMSRGLGAYASWQLGHGDKALRQLDHATRWLQSHDKGLFISLLHGWLADAHATRGQAHAVRQHALRALLRTRQGDWFGAAMAGRALARTAAARGDSSSAWRHLRTAQRAARVRQSPHEQMHNALCVAELADGTGQAATARQALAEARHISERLGLPLPFRQALALPQAPPEGPDTAA